MNAPETPAKGSDYHPFLVGDWKVEPSAGQISKDEIQVKLEPKVMDLLSYLASQQGELVTRDDLERDVWKGAIVGYDSITTAIVKLRKALTDDALSITPPSIVALPFENLSSDATGEYFADGMPE